MSELLSDVGAVVVTFGHPEMVEECLEALRQSRVGQIVVWDNTEDAEERARIEHLCAGDVEYVSDGVNYGFGRANNRASARISLGKIVFVNPDCFVSASTLSRLAEHLEENVDLGVVAPLMSNPDGTFGVAGGPAPSLTKELMAATSLDDRLPSRVRAAIHSRYFGTDRSASTVLRQVFWVSGFCLMVRTSDFRRIHGFNDRFFLYFEDVDLCRNMSQMGKWSGIATDVHAVHLGSATTGTSKSAHYWRGQATYWATAGSPLKARLCRTMANWRDRPVSIGAVRGA